MWVYGVSGKSLRPMGAVAWMLVTDGFGHSRIFAVIPRGVIGSGRRIEEDTHVGAAGGVIFTSRLDSDRPIHPVTWVR